MLMSFDGFLSLSMFSKFIHFVASIFSLPYIPLYGYISHFVPSWVDRHLGFFHFLGIINYATEGT